MAYKEYSKYMNERMTRTPEGQKSLQEYNQYKKVVTELPKKVAKAAVEGVKKVPRKIIGGLGKVAIKMLPSRTIKVK